MKMMRRRPITNSKVAHPIDRADESDRLRHGKLKARTPERWQSGRMRRFAKPLYGLTPVPRVRIPPSPPDSQS